MQPGRPMGLCALSLLVLVATPVHARDLFVSAEALGASDENNGSEAHPWKTISHAARCAEPGDTVWIHGATYRETVLVEKSGAGPDRMLAFRAMPGEKVVVKGSEVLTGWTRCPDEPDRPIWETTWPFKGIFPGMIGADDTPLVPMNVPPETEELKPPKAYCQYFLGFGRGREAMVPGSFYYDQPRQKLLVWLRGDEDPNAHTMEAAVRACWDSRGNYILVEGITFRYAPLVVPVGGVCFVMTGPGGGGAPAEGCIVRNCDVSLAAFEGMVVRGGKRMSTVVEDCWVHHNGDGCGSFEGLADPDSDSWVIVRRCRLTDNNLFNWNPAWHAGGKHFGTRVFFDECEFARNYNSPGLWFDIHERDCIVNRCHAHQNGQFGLYYEIGETGAFISNVVEGGPHYCALALSGSSRTLVAHNVITTGARGILVGGEGRAEGQVGRVTCYDSVYNNLLLGRGQPLITISPESDLACANASDNNLLWQIAGPAETMAFSEDGGADGKPMDLDQWRAARKLDLASRVADPLVEVKNGRLRRLPDSASVSGGKRLSADDIRAIFALRPMPQIDLDTGSASIRDHRPVTEAFLRKVAELLAVPDGAPVPLGPLPHDDPTVSLPIENADFENPPLPTNGVSGAPPDWASVGNAAQGPVIWHAADTGLWNWYMPSGSNVLVLPPGGDDVGISQELRATLQARTRYRLSVWAGQRIDESGLPWPRVELALWARDRLLRSVEIPEPAIKPHFGVWVENVLTYTTADDAPAGQPLRITLRRLGPARAQTCFDDVSLVATPVTP